MKSVDNEFRSLEPRLKGRLRLDGIEKLTCSVVGDVGRNLVAKHVVDESENFFWLLVRFE